MQNEMITWKCLQKLNEKELKETVDWIKSGQVDFRQRGWEDVYPTNEDILEFAKNG